MAHETQEPIDKIEKEAGRIFKIFRDEVTETLDRIGEDVSRNVNKLDKKPLVTFGSAFLGGCIAGIFLGRNMRELVGSGNRKRLRGEGDPSKVA